MSERNDRIDTARSVHEVHLISPHDSFHDAGVRP